MAAQVPAQAQAPFALAPGLVDNNPIDYSTSEGAKLFKAATAALKDEFDCSTSNLKTFLSSIGDRSGQHGWDDILEIPEDLNVPNPVTHELLTEYGRITLDQVRDHAMTYNNLQTRQAQASYSLYLCLVNTLTKTARAKVMLKEDQYTPNGIRSGPCFLKVIIAESYLDSNATTKFIREALANLEEYMKEVDSDVPKFNDYVQDLVDSLSARGEQTHDLLANLFKGYAAASDDKFVEYMEQKESLYDEGTNYTPEQLMSLAKNKYAQLVQKKIWKAPSEDQRKIIALQAQVQKLQQANKKNNTLNSPNPKKSPPPKGTPAKRERPAWMAIAPKDGEKRTKTVDNKEYHWCPKHKSWVRHRPQDCKGLGQKAPKPEQAEDKTKNAQANDPKIKLSAALANIAESTQE